MRKSEYSQVRIPPHTVTEYVCFSRLTGTPGLVNVVTNLSTRLFNIFITEIL